jgi:uncharacterized protein (DUF2267 family)
MVGSAARRCTVRVSAKRVVGGVVIVGAALVLRPGTRANKAVCHQIDAAGKRLRFFGGQLRGVSYRLRGRHPAPDVVDNVLADRIRSELGGLEKRLDLPHVHVMVNDHVAMLHGEVGSQADADQIERAVEAVSGVAGVESYLHVGLGRGDSRPSAGRAVEHPSDALRRLMDAAVGEGIAPDRAHAVVRAVLATFADRLPATERDKVDAHLPADVRALFSPPRRAHRPARVHNIHELVARVAFPGGELPADKAEQVATAIVRAFRDLVPDEAGHVGAVLPAELRALWQGETPVEDRADGQ